MDKSYGSYEGKRRRDKQRAKFKASIEKRMKDSTSASVVNPAIGRTGANTVDAAGVETFTKPGHEGWKIDTGPSTRSNAPKAKVPQITDPTTKSLNFERNRTNYLGTSNVPKVSTKADGSVVVDLGKNPHKTTQAAGAQLAKWAAEKKSNPSSAGATSSDRPFYSLPKDSPHRVAQTPVKPSTEPRNPVATLGKVVAGAAILTGAAVASKGIFSGSDAEIRAAAEAVGKKPKPPIDLTNPLPEPQNPRIETVRRLSMADQREGQATDLKAGFDKAASLDERHAARRAAQGRQLKAAFEAAERADQRSLTIAFDEGKKAQLAARPKTATEKFGATEAEAPKVATSGETTTEATAKIESNNARIADLQKQLHIVDEPGSGGQREGDRRVGEPTRRGSDRMTKGQVDETIAPGREPARQRSNRRSPDNERRGKLAEVPVVKEPEAGPISKADSKSPTNVPAEQLRNIDLIAKGQDPEVPLSKATEEAKLTALQAKGKLRTTGADTITTSTEAIAVADARERLATGVDRRVEDRRNPLQKLQDEIREGEERRQQLTNSLNDQRSGRRASDVVIEVKAPDVTPVSKDKPPKAKTPKAKTPKAEVKVTVVPQVDPNLDPSAMTEAEKQAKIAANEKRMAEIRALQQAEAPKAEAPKAEAPDVPKVEVPKTRYARPPTEKKVKKATKRYYDKRDKKVKDLINEIDPETGLPKKPTAVSSIEETSPSKAEAEQKIIKQREVQTKIGETEVAIANEPELTKERFKVPEVVTPTIRDKRTAEQIAEMNEKKVVIPYQEPVDVNELEHQRLMERLHSDAETEIDAQGSGKNPETAEVKAIEEQMAANEKRMEEIKQALETEQDLRVEERRQLPTRRDQKTRFTQAEAKEAGVEYPPAPKKTSRRDKGSERRGASIPDTEITLPTPKARAPKAEANPYADLTAKDIAEIAEAAGRGDPIAKTMLKEASAARAALRPTAPETAPEPDLVVGKTPEQYDIEATRILKESGFEPMDEADFRTMTPEEVDKVTKRRTLEDLRAASREAMAYAENLPTGPNQLKTRAEIEAAMDLRRRMGAVDLPTPRAGTGLGMFAAETPAEMEAEAAQRNLDRTRRRVEAQARPPEQRAGTRKDPRFGQRRVQDVPITVLPGEAAREGGERRISGRAGRRDLSKQTRGVPYRQAAIPDTPAYYEYLRTLRGEEPPAPGPVSTDRRATEFGQRPQTLDEMTRSVMESYRRRNAPTTGAPPLTSPSIRGDETRVPKPELTNKPTAEGGIRVRAADILKKAGRAVVRGVTSPKAKGAAGVGVGLGVGTAAFMVPDVASAYMDASGVQRERIKAAGGQALESGIQIGIGMGIFSGLLAGATKLASEAYKPVIGGLGHAVGTAAVGYTAGSFAGNIYSRIRRAQEKNIRDEAYAKEKYGTVEAATRTRKGLKADGKPLTLDEAGVMRDRHFKEQYGEPMTLSEADAIMEQWEKGKK